MTDAGGAAASSRRIALVLTQKRDSGNWDPAGYAAARSMADRHGFALEVVGGVGFDAAAATFKDLAGSGVELVMGHASDYAGPMLDVAAHHPETNFGVFSYITSTGGLPNLAGWTVSWNEVEFLTGVVAGLVSKQGHIGTVRGVELVPAEFALGNLVRGARHVNPDIRVEVEHINDWNDFAGATESTRRLVALGCDVIYGAADSADATIQGTCAELGVLTFGEYIDEGDAFPGAIITSFMVNEARAYDEMGAMLAAGVWAPGIRVMDVSSGDIRFAEFRNVDAGVRSRFDDIYRQIATRELTVSN